MKRIVNGMSFVLLVPMMCHFFYLLIVSCALTSFWARAGELERTPVTDLSPHLRKKQLWCPLAVTRNGGMKTEGRPRHGYPQGAVIHYTASHERRGIARPMSRWAKSAGLGFFIIDTDGKVYQYFPLNRFADHAKRKGSKHPKVKYERFGASKEFVGIEMINVGKLREGNLPEWVARDESGKLIPNPQLHNADAKVPLYEIPESEIREITEDMNWQWTYPGRYKKYTRAQEVALVRLLVWLKINNPDVFDFEMVVGHDEVSGQRFFKQWRKHDPGGALSMDMMNFRKLLNRLYQRALNRKVNNP